MSNNIKQLRKEQGLSVTELASKLNMSQGNLTKIENGQIELKADTAEKIAAALNVSPQALQERKTSAGIMMLELINPQILSLPALSRLPVPADLVPNTPKNAAIYVMTDDTMSPHVPLGALVIIDKGNNNFTTNGIYLLQVGQTIVLRRLQQTFSSSINILCDNNSYIPQQMDIESINIIGRAIFSLSSISL